MSVRRQWIRNAVWSITIVCRPLFDYSTSNGQEAKLQTASSNSGGSRHQVRLNNCAGDWRLELLHSGAVTVVNDISRVVDRIASDGSTPNLLHIYQRTRGSSGGLPGLIWDYDLGQSACKQHPSRDNEFFPGTGRPTRVARNKTKLFQKIASTKKEMVKL